MFTCAYDTTQTAHEEVADLTARGLELLSYHAGKGGGGNAEMVVQFPTWQALVDFTVEYLNDDCGDREDQGESYIYGYLLKFARCPNSW